MVEPAPMTAERRREIEAVRRRMIDTAERAGIPALTSPATTAIADLLAEIDRLTAERDAAVAAAVMARGAVFHEFAAAIRSRPAPTPAVEDKDG